MQFILGILVPTAPSMIGFTGSFTILAVIPSTAAFYIGVVLFTFNLMQQPAIIAVVASRVPEKERGVMVGAFSALSKISALIGAQLTCVVYDVVPNVVYVHACLLPRM
jgi:hypothetical protein